MKRLYLPLAAATLCMAIPIAPASGGLMIPGLSLNGVQDVWQDNSVAMAFDNDADFTVSVGDEILGIVRVITNTTDAIDISPALGELDIVFAFEVLTATPRAGVVPDVAYTLGAAPGRLAAALPTFAIAAGDGVAILSDPNPTPAVGADPTQLPAGAGVPAAGNAWARLNDGSYQLDATAAMVGSDFVEATLLDVVTGPPAGTPGSDGMITLPGHPVAGYEYVNFAATTKTGDEAGGFTFTFSPGGVPWVPVPETHLPGAPFPVPTATTFHDIAFDSTLRVPDSTQLGNGWVFSDDSRIKLNGLPEPASIIVWTGLFVGLVGWRCSRRRKAQ